jgi:hypothetical protein
MRTGRLLGSAQHAPHQRGRLSARERNESADAGIDLRFAARSAGKIPRWGAPDSLTARPAKMRPITEIRGIGRELPKGANFQRARTPERRGLPNDADSRTTPTPEERKLPGGGYRSFDFARDDSSGSLPWSSRASEASRGICTTGGGLYSFAPPGSFRRLGVRAVWESALSGSPRRLGVRAVWQFALSAFRLPPRIP